MTEQDLSIKRINVWRGPYLASTRKSYHRAQGFFQKGDYFTAYLYLFVTFNNLYSYLARFGNGSESDRIRNAIGCITDDNVAQIYNSQYLEVLNCLNERTPEQDGGGRLGVVNMRYYLQGKDPCVYVKHIKHIANEEASAVEKKCTLQNLAAELLYTIRNNQFHAIKDPITDESVLRWAYCLLDPIVCVLLQVADQE